MAHSDDLAAVRSCASLPQTQGKRPDAMLIVPDQTLQAYAHQTNERRVVQTTKSVDTTTIKKGHPLHCGDLARVSLSS